MPDTIIFSGPRDFKHGEDASFDATVGGKRIVCRVSYEALIGFKKDPDEVVPDRDLFDRGWSTIELAAKAKIRNGQLEENGEVHLTWRNLQAEQ